MKKSAKPFIAKILFILLVVTAIVLGNVGLRLMYEDLTRKKVELGKKINDEGTKKVNLIAQYQAYSSEDRIILIAENKLSMLRRIQPKVTVSVSKSLINKVNKKLKAKYE
jgi:cell division protein FtsL